MQFKKAYFPALILILTLALSACGETAPPVTATIAAAPTDTSQPTLSPTEVPEPVKIAPTEEASGAPELAPTAVAEPTRIPQTSEPGIPPTETPQLAIPVGEPSATPTFAAPAAYARLPKACSLMTPEEVSAFIPNPPAPAFQETVDASYLGSSCQYKNEEMEFGIAIGLLSYTHGNFDILQNKEKFPLKFSSSGADYYQAGGVTQELDKGVFAALVTKGDIFFYLMGSGKSYHYEAYKISLLLENIASRLPDIPTPPTACALVTLEELAEVFPNPVGLVSSEEENPPTSMCTFGGETNWGRISISSCPDVRDILESQKANFMQIAPSFIQSSVAGADVFQTGGPVLQEGGGEFFFALIQKGDYCVGVMVESPSYQYDPTREASFLEKIIARLP